MPIASLNSIDDSKKFTWCGGCESVQISNNPKHDRELKLIGCCNCRDIQLNKLGI
jgi:hypothetical protein